MSKSKILPLILFLMATLVAACAGPGGDLPPISDAPLSEYRLGPGDQVRVIVFGFNLPSNDYTVSDTGTIAMPLVGVVPAAGHTADGLAANVQQRVEAAQLEREPSVSVQIDRYRPFFVLGEVAKPGSYSYVPGMTLRTAVAIAGGYTFRAEEDYAAITRTIGDEPVDGKAMPSTPILPGDTIYVYESWF